MHCQYRVAKYDPNNRNEWGHYIKDEWTSFSDIGKAFADGVFTYDEYEKAESAYINTIFAFMECISIKALKLTAVWNGKRYKEAGFQFKNGTEYSGEKLRRVIQLTLRGKIGCHLVSEPSMFVHFGYDYYMYIGTNKLCPEALARAKESGLHPEKFESPYLDSE